MQEAGLSHSYHFRGLISNHCEGCDALLRVARGLNKDWFDFEGMHLLTKLDVEPSTALLAGSRVCKLNRNTLNDHDWFPYDFDTKTIINNRGLNTTIRCVPDGSVDRVGGGDVRALYIDEFDDLCVTLEFAKALLNRSRRRRDPYFGIPLLEANDGVLNLTSAAIFADIFFDADAINYLVGAIMDVNVNDE